MLHIVDQYKKMLMTGIVSHLQSVDANPVPESQPVIVPVKPDSPEVQAVETEKAEAIDVVKGVTQEQLGDLSAALSIVNTGNAITRGSDSAAVRDVQEIFVHLGVNIGTFGPDANGIDGDYGSTMKRVVSAFQTENGLTVSGSVDKQTYDALLVAAGLAVKPTEARVSQTAQELEAAKQRAQEQATALEAARATVNREVEETQVATDALKENTDALEANTTLLDGKAAEIKDLEDELLVLEGRLASAESIDERIETYTAAQDVFTREQSELQAVQESLTNIQSELQAQETTLRDTTAEYQTERAQAMQAQQVLETAQATFDAMQFTGGIAEIKSVVEAQASYDVYRSAAQVAEDRAQESEKKWNDSKFSNFFTGFEDIANINRDAANTAEATSQEALKILELAQAKEALDAAQAAFTQESAEASSALTALRQATSATSTLQIGVQALEAQITVAQGEFTDAQSALEGVRDGAARITAPEDTDALRQGITSIQTDTITLRSDIASLTATVAALRQASSQLQSNVATQEAELEAAQKATPEIEALDTNAQQALAQAEQFSNEANTELQREMTAAEALAALKLLEKETGKGAIKAIQQALIDSGIDLGSSGADGVVGTKTKAAIEAQPQIVLSTLASYIDTTDNERNKARVSAERPADGDAIDAALTSFLSGQNSTSTYTSDMATQIASEFTGEGIDANRRNKNAQYISLKLQELGMEDNSEAQRLMERIMAEGKGHYENLETALMDSLVDGSGRFARGLARFPENFNGSYYKIGQALRSRRPDLEAGMKQGISGNAHEILDQIFGVGSDYIATRMHVVTGQGQDGDADMSLELAGGLQLSNAYYDAASGAIYAVVARGNGCEGNLVVIPIETFIAPPPKPKPKPKIVPPVVPPVIPPVIPPVGPPDTPGRDPDPEIGGGFTTPQTGGGGRNDVQDGGQVENDDPDTSTTENPGGIF